MLKTLIIAGIISGISVTIVSFKAEYSQNVKGKELYIQYCQNCHMENGEGVEGLYPPVAKTNYIKDTKKIIDVVLKGQFGEVIVNGKKYNTDMPAQDYLTDEQIADILTYIRSSWGNKFPAVKAAQVKAQRK